MNLILSKKTGKFLIENRYPLATKKEGMKVTFGFERDPKATFSDLVKIADHANSREFAGKMSKKLGEPCQAVTCAIRPLTWHDRID